MCCPIQANNLAVRLSNIKPCVIILENREDNVNRGVKPCVLYGIKTR